MALELLSGPHTVTDLATDDPVESLSSFRMLWVDPLGLLAAGSSIGNTVTQMDGSTVEFTENINNMYWGIALVDGRPWYSVTLATGSSSSSTTEWALNRVTHVYESLLSATAPADMLNPYAHVSDRYLRLAGGTVQYTVNAADSWHTDATISGFSDGSCFSWAREAGHMWLGGSTGKVVRYDYVNKVASSTVLKIGLAACAGVWYSAKHDVFVSIRQNGSNFEMHVWARTPLPASLAVPTASPSVAAGRAMTLTTRVMGADSDPCPNEVVTWSLTGEGALESEFTATDADGYATNRLVLPVDAAGPSVQVDVELAIP